MSERTLKIINICKKQGKYTKGSFYNRLTSYLSEECLCPKEDYSPRIVEEILMEAVYEYIDCCDTPSSFIKSLYSYSLKYSIIDAICYAFMFVQVKNKQNQFVNGFDENFEIVRNMML